MITIYTLRNRVLKPRQSPYGTDDIMTFFNRNGSDADKCRFAFVSDDPSTVDKLRERILAVLDAPDGLTPDVLAVIAKIRAHLESGAMIVRKELPESSYLRVVPKK